MDWCPGAPRKGPSDFVCMSDLLGKGTSEEEKFTGEQVNDTVILCYSSGTTGKPKGVEVSDASSPPGRADRYFLADYPQKPSLEPHLEQRLLPDPALGCAKGPGLRPVLPHLR